MDLGGLGQDASEERRARAAETIERNLYLLEDLLGEGHPKVQHAKTRVAELTEEVGVVFGSYYAGWASAYPSLIATEPATQICYCPESGGWVPEVDHVGIERWRPCERCNKEAAEAMLVRAGLKQPEPAQ